MNSLRTSKLAPSISMDRRARRRATCRLNLVLIPTWSPNPNPNPVSVPLPSCDSLRRSILSMNSRSSCGRPAISSHLRLSLLPDARADVTLSAWAMTSSATCWLTAAAAALYEAAVSGDMSSRSVFSICATAFPEISKRRCATARAYTGPIGDALMYIASSGSDGCCFGRLFEAPVDKPMDGAMDEASINGAPMEPSPPSPPPFPLPLPLARSLPFAPPPYTYGGTQLHHHADDVHAGPPPPPPPPPPIPFPAPSPFPCPPPSTAASPPATSLYAVAILDRCTIISASHRCAICCCPPSLSQSSLVRSSSSSSYSTADSDASASTNDSDSARFSISLAAASRPPPPRSSSRHLGSSRTNHPTNNSAHFFFCDGRTIIRILANAPMHSAIRTPTSSRLTGTSRDIVNSNGSALLSII